MAEIVYKILRSRHAVTMGFPRSGISPALIHFGKGELSDILGFGFSFIEQADHCVSYVLVSPIMAKRIACEIDAFYFTAETPHVGMLWTARVFITDKIRDSSIVFSNEDQWVVLCLNTNNMED
jgi:hypothetical protein